MLFRVVGSPPTHDPAISLQSHTPGDAPSSLLCNSVSFPSSFLPSDICSWSVFELLAHRALVASFYRFIFVILTILLSPLGPVNHSFFSAHAAVSRS